MPRHRFAVLGDSAARPVATEKCFWALRDVALEVKQGEVLGIIGRNGAGKSTLLKILSRVTRPTTGLAEVYGRVGSLLEVGTGFHAELTGRENIYLSGAVLGMKKAEIAKKFDEIVDFSGVEKFLDTPAKHYSSGMYVRLAFAVAAHLEPEILLVDEVLAVGDVEFQKKCLGKMGAVAKGGRTVLFVSHNMNAIERLCGKVLLLDGGTVRAISSDVRSTINEYLCGTEDVDYASEWMNSGNAFDNEWFKPNRFTISDSTGKAQMMPVGYGTEMWVEIAGDIKRFDPALTLGYVLYSDDGHVLYYSISKDGSQSSSFDLYPGHWVFRSPLPRRLLNEGHYRIELLAFLHGSEWISQPGISAPVIRMEVRGGMAGAPYFLSERPGLLAPSLEWQAERRPSPEQR